jgi:hypothetical protein
MFHFCAFPNFGYGFLTRKPYVVTRTMTNLTQATLANPTVWIMSHTIAQAASVSLELEDEPSLRDLLSRLVEVLVRIRVRLDVRIELMSQGAPYRA